MHPAFDGVFREVLSTLRSYSITQVLQPSRETERRRRNKSIDSVWKKCHYALKGWNRENGTKGKR